MHSTRGKTWPWMLAMGILFGALILPISAAGAPDTRYQIRLLERSFTPAISRAPGAGLAAAAVEDLGQAADRLAAAGEQKLHLLVQLWEVPSESDKFELWRQGLDLGAYVPGNAFIAAVPATTARLALASPALRWADAWTAERKVHPRLKVGDIAPWALDPSRPEWVMTLVQLHHDVDLARIWAVADAVGGVAMEPIEGIHGATVWVPRDRLEKLAGIEDVLWVEEGPPPLSPNNDGVRAQMKINDINAAPYNLNGTGVRLLVFDGGAVRATHQTFDPGTGSRVTVIDGSAAADHPTHVAGTAAGDGSGSAGNRGRGAAEAATILSAGYSQTGGTMLFWDNAGDIQADYALARNTHNADLANNSIGSNTANNGYPCSREGDYGVTSNLLDGIARGNNATVGSAVIFSWANGNERSGGSPRARCGSNYLTTAEPSCAKNPIHVGALNSDGGSMTRFSSWGPCDDGRMKPVISAPGCESGRVTGETSVFSSLNTSDSAYGGFCGTSMATPAVSGLISLFIQDWRAQGHGGATARPLPALVKTLLIASATDLGQDGPDYIYGYGAVDGKALIDLLRADNGVLGDGGTTAWGTDSASAASVDNFSITVPAGTGVLKATLAWDDAAAAAFAAVAPVNDLTLQLIAPDSTVRQAWVLSAANPHLPATTGVNSLDNQEQVLVENPAAGIWTVRVTGTSVPQGPQSYALAYSATPAAFNAGACSTGLSSTYEAGLDGWAVTGAAQTAAPAAGHGSFSLRLGGAISTTHEATRDVAIPAGVGKAEWTYFWYMTTTEVAATGLGFDDFFAEVRSTTGTVLAAVDLRNDGWRAGAWMAMQNIDLTPWAGQTVRLAFRAVNSASRATTFWVDDVAVTTCPTGGGGNTPPVVAITTPANGSSFTAGTAINFSGTATDAEDGNISASLAWTSSLNGAIGSGASFSTSALAVGSHTITAAVTDSGGLPGSAAINLNVTSSSITVTFTSIGAEDGRIVESGENTSVGGTATASGSGTGALRLGDDNQDRQLRSVLSFDTSSIPDTATVISATLQLRRGSLTGTNPFGTHGACQVDIVNGAFGGANALAAADFQAAATATNVGTLSNPAANGALSTAALNVAGLAAINKTGRTQLRAAFATDDNNDNGNDYIGFYGGETGTATNRPVLVVTYTP